MLSQRQEQTPRWLVSQELYESYVQFKREEAKDEASLSGGVGSEDGLQSDAVILSREELELELGALEPKERSEEIEMYRIGFHAWAAQIQQHLREHEMDPATAETLRRRAEELFHLTRSVGKRPPNN